MVSDVAVTGPELRTRADRTDARSIPDAVAPPPRHARFPLIDGVRAIAVLAVVAVHSALGSSAVSIPGAERVLVHLNVGVTIFFVISGFLLYRPFIAHRAGGPAAPRTAAYAKRRFLRIYPAYWAVLTILVIVPGVTGVIDGHWWPMYALVHTLPIYHGRECVQVAQQCGLAQTWSLVVELTFYVALPIYALIIRRITRGLTVRGWMRAELLVLAVLSALSVLLQFFVLYPSSTWLGSTVAGYVWWFALGMGTAVVSVGVPTDERAPLPLRALLTHPGLAWLLALAAYVALCLKLPQSPFLFQRDDELLAHLAFGLVAMLLVVPAVFCERRGVPRRVLAHPVMAWLGLVSYGIFLWHYVIALKLGRDGAGLSFVGVLAGTLAISIGCAAASYYLIERPLLRLKYRRL